MVVHIHRTVDLAGVPSLGLEAVGPSRDGVGEVLGEVLEEVLGVVDRNYPVAVHKEFHSLVGKH